jgi:hypothetical protein
VKIMRNGLRFASISSQSGTYLDTRKICR